MGMGGVGPAGQRAEVSIFYILYFYILYCNIFIYAIKIERGQRNTKRALLTGSHTLRPRKYIFGHKMLMKSSHNCSY